MTRTTGRTHGTDYEDFGKKIAEAREAKGLSQKEASGSLGMPQSTYAGYETGARKIPLSVIKELSRFYEISADQLLGYGTADISSGISDYLNEEKFTEEEIKEILLYAGFIKSKRNKKNI